MPQKECEDLVLQAVTQVLLYVWVVHIIIPTFVLELIVGRQSGETAAQEDVAGWQLSPR